jgi:CHAP domain
MGGGAIAATGPVAKTSAATKCLGSTLPTPSRPILTDAQAIAALHQSVTFAGESGRSRTPTCQWNGSPLPASQVGPYSHYQVQLWLNLHGPFATRSAARSYYEPMTTVFGQPTPAPGVGTAAVFRPGQDEVTAQLLVLAGKYVFGLSLNSSLPQAAQQSDLIAVADTILARLGQPTAPQRRPKRRWASDWASKKFCRTKRDGYQYLGTTWHGVAACGAPYPNNAQGNIGYNGVTFDTYGFQCVELAERYFYWVTGRAGAFANGSDLAEVLYYDYRSKIHGLGLYPNVRLGGTSTYQSTLQAGDIISLWSNSDDVVGHVGVVIGVKLHRGSGGKPTGYIKVMDENASASGVDFIEVTNGSMWFPNGSYPYFQWLYGLPAAQ